MAKSIETNRTIGVDRVSYIIIIINYYYYHEHRYEITKFGRTRSNLLLLLLACDAVLIWMGGFVVIVMLLLLLLLLVVKSGRDSRMYHQDWCKPLKKYVIKIKGESVSYYKGLSD